MTPAELRAFGRWAIGGGAAGALIGIVFAERNPTAIFGLAILGFVLGFVGGGIWKHLRPPPPPPPPADVDAGTQDGEPR